jgi:hypothetical protein
MLSPAKFTMVLWIEVLLEKNGPIAGAKFKEAEWKVSR